MAARKKTPKKPAPYASESLAVSRRMIAPGTADAERAADVANEVRGVRCKLRDIP